MSTQLWRSGTDILLDMKIIAHARARAPQSEAGTPVTRANAIMHAYLTFCALLDDLPPWLANPDSYSAPDEAVALQYRRSFWAQKTNLIVTYHCFRLAIIRQAEKHGLCHLFGLTNDGSMLAMRRLKISNDMLLAVKSVPFESLQANGEPGAEKLRQAGVELFGIAHQTDDQVLAARANALFSQLLDVITSLNSKVSEELAGILAL
ncbi:Phenylacetone monooxygenase [Verticillium dahliae VDG2]|nr:Phenylacetone monooxygenase [Verticillium dahliae VDG2]